MNDNDIIKALGYCFAVGDCEHCIYADKPCQELMADALDLINRQKAEIEALKLINSTYEVETKRVRDIAIEEVAEKIKNIDLYRCVEEHYKNAEPYYEVRRDLFCGYIDNLVEEMTEEQE
jgi:hypothetical protein